MLGSIFLLIIGLFGGYTLLTDYRGWGSALAGLVGFSYEPVTGTSLFTDWLTWAVTDTVGLMWLGSIAFVLLVLLFNVAQTSGHDAFR